MTQILDRRIIKTREAIESAFITLIKKKGFDRLTVKEIAEAANVGRKTFYLHFRDLYDVSDYVIQKEMKGIANACEISKKTTYEEGALAWFLYMESKKDIFLPLLRSKKTDVFRECLFNLLMEDLQKKAESRGFVLKMVDCHFFSHAIMGIIESMLTDCLEISVEEVAMRVGEILEKSLQGDDK